MEVWSVGRCSQSLSMKLQSFLTTYLSSWFLTLNQNLFLAAPPHNATVDLTNNDSFINDSHINISQASTSAHDSFNDSHNNISHVSSDATNNSLHDNSHHSHVSSAHHSKDEQSESFLQDIINNMSQEELELNMKMIEESKANQQAQQNHQQADRSYHDDVGIQVCC